MNTRDLDRPFEDTLAECMSLLERIDHLLGAFEPMSSDEIRRTPKLPKHGAAIVAEIVDVCSALEIAEVGPARVEEMARSLDQAGATRRVIERVELVLARLNSSRMSSETLGWKSALTFYALFRRMARDDESLRARIQPVASSFRVQARRPKKRPDMG
jgi:hypothetical protein